MTTAGECAMIGRSQAIASKAAKLAGVSSQKQKQKGGSVETLWKVWNKGRGLVWDAEAVGTTTIPSGSQ